MTVKTPVLMPNNPFPAGPTRAHPHASHFIAARRAMIHDVREHVKNIRREIRNSTPVMLDVAETPLQNMSVPALKAKAKERGLSGYSKMNKQALVDLLSKEAWT